MNMSFRQIHIVVMAFSKDGDRSFKLIVEQHHFILVWATFLGDELKDKLFGLTYLQDTFLFVDLEAIRHFDMPFCCLLSDVSNHDGFFSSMLDGYKAEI